MATLDIGVFAKFHHAVTDIIRDPSSLKTKQFNTLLAVVKPFLQSIVVTPESQNVEAKENLKQGIFIHHKTQYKLSQEFIKTVHDLAKIAGSPDLQMVQLLHHYVHHEKLTIPQAELHALRNYFEERAYKFESLRLMVVAVHDTRVTSSVQSLFKLHLQDITFCQNPTKFETFLKSNLDQYKSMEDRLEKLAQEPGSEKKKLILDSSKSESVEIVSLLFFLHFYLNDHGFGFINHVWKFLTTRTTGNFNNNNNNKFDTISTILLGIICSNMIKPFSQFSYFSGNQKPNGSSLTINQEMTNILELKAELEKSNHDFKGLVLLTLSIFFKQSLGSNPQSLSSFNIADSDVNKLVDDSINNNALEQLVVMSSKLSNFWTPKDHVLLTDISQQPSLISKIEFPGNHYSTNINVPEELNIYLSNLLQELVFNLVRICTNMVKSMRNSDEDADQYLRETRADQNIYTKPTTETQPRRFESLLTLVTILFAGPVDIGLRFWSETDLQKFIRYGMESRSPFILRNVVLMLASLTRGEVCSQYAHNLLSLEGRVSYTALFKAINTYASVFAQNSNSTIPPDEEITIRCYLRLFSTLVQYSPSARFILYENPVIRPFQSVFNLLVCRIPLSLKAELMDVLVAFTYPVEHPMDDICRSVWALLEQCQIIPTTTISLTSTALGNPNTRGLPFDLEDLEAEQQSYSSTLSFLRLISNLLNPLVSGQLVEDLTQISQGTIIIKNIWPYINFTIENVYLKIPIRGFTSTQEKYEMLFLCSSIFRSCLESVDLQRLSKVLGVTSISADLLHHPGFRFIHLIFAGQSFTQHLFQQLSSSSDLLQNTDHPLAVSYIENLLWLLHRLIQEQSFFLALMNSSTEVASHFKVGIVAIDELLAYHKEVVISLASLLHPIFPMKITLQAVEILLQLSKSEVFNILSDSSAVYGTKITRLVSILSSSEKSVFIKEAVRQRILLAADELALSPSGVIISQDDEPSQRIRYVCLQLLKSTKGRCGLSSLGFYLLGFSMKRTLKNYEIRELGDDQAPTTLIALVNQFTVPLNAFEPENIDNVKSYILHNPTLYQEFSEILDGLASDDTISSSILQYLRSKNDFLISHISLNLGTMLSQQFGDSAHAKLLYAKARLLHLAAVDIHFLFSHGNTGPAKSYLDMLFSERKDGRELSSNSNNIFGSSFYNDTSMTSSRTNQFVDSLFEIDTQQVELEPQISQFQRELLEQIKPSDMQGELLTETKLRLFNVQEIALQLRLIMQRFVTPIGISEEYEKLIEEVKMLLQQLIAVNEAKLYYNARMRFVKSWCQFLSVLVVDASDFLKNQKSIDFVFDLSIFALNQIFTMKSSRLAKSWLYSLVAILTQHLAKFSIIGTFQKENSETDRILTLLKCLTTALTDSNLHNMTKVDLMTAMIHTLNMASDEISLDQNLLAENQNFVKCIISEIQFGDDISETTVFALLSKVVSMMHSVSMSKLMLQSNLLSHLAPSFKKAYHGVVELYEKKNTSMNGLYVFQSLLSLMVSMSKEESFCLRLVDSEIFDTICQIRFPDLPSLQSYEADFLPDHRELYHEFVTPVLVLMKAMTSRFESFTIYQQDKILHFLSKNTDLLVHLGSDLQRPTLYTLEEVFLVWTIVAASSRRLKEFSQVKSSLESFCKKLVVNYTDEKKFLHRLSIVNEFEQSTSKMIPSFLNNHKLSIHQMKAQSYMRETLIQVLLYLKYEKAIISSLKAEWVSLLNLLTNYIQVHFEDLRLLDLIEGKGFEPEQRIHAEILLGKPSTETGRTVSVTKKRELMNQIKKLFLNKINDILLIVELCLSSGLSVPSSEEFKKDLKSMGVFRKPFGEMIPKNIQVNVQALDAMITRL